MSSMTLLVGNVGSGKSFFASKLHKLFGDVIVNMDDLQQSMAGGDYNAYDPGKKALYHALEDQMIRSSLIKGHSVIIDRASLMSKETRRRFITTAKQNGVNVFVYDFGPGTKEELKRRQANPRGGSPEKWELVWEKMKDSYQQPTNEEGLIILSPPKKYIFHAFDFDGTLATKADFPECGEPIQENIEVVKGLYEKYDSVIIIWTCRGGAEKLGPMYEWLKKHDVPYDFVNENPLVPRDGSPKIFANFYWDNNNANKSEFIK